MPPLDRIVIATEVLYHQFSHRHRGSIHVVPPLSPPYRVLAGARLVVSGASPDHHHPHLPQLQPRRLSLISFSATSFAVLCASPRVPGPPLPIPPPFGLSTPIACCHRPSSPPSVGIAPIILWPPILSRCNPLATAKLVLASFFDVRRRATVAAAHLICRSAASVLP